MTVVAVANYVHGLLVVADTQVSYRNNGQLIANDRIGVQKIFMMDSSSSHIVFGFSGRIEPARKIFDYLYREKINKTSERIILHLHQRLPNWIEEKTREDPKYYSGISLMMCGIEKGLRDVSVNSTGQREYLPFPRKYAYSYIVKQDGSVEQTKTKDHVIGAGKKIYQTVIDRIYETVGFATGLPDADIHRTQAALGFFSLLFRDKPILGIGPPYIGIFVSRERTVPVYEWEFDIPIKSLQVADTGIVEIKCLRLDQTRILVPLRLWTEEEFRPKTIGSYNAAFAE